MFPKRDTKKNPTFLQNPTSGFPNFLWVVLRLYYGIMKLLDCGCTQVSLGFLDRSGCVSMTQIQWHLLSGMHWIRTINNPTCPATDSFSEGRHQETLMLGRKMHCTQANSWAVWKRLTATRCVCVCLLQAVKSDLRFHAWHDKMWSCFLSRKLAWHFPKVFWLPRWNKSTKLKSQCC